MKRQDFNLANDLIASKRLQLDEVVSQVKGVMLFFSSVGGVTSNRPKKKPEKDSKTSKQREDSNEEKKAQDTGDKTADQPGENKDLDIPYPAVSYFIICRRGLADAASNIHKALHEAETEVEVKELKTKKKNVGEEKEVLAKLCQVLKDHNSSYAQSLLRSSVDFCYNQALRHNLEETSDEEKRRLFPFLTASADDTSLKDLKVPTRLTVIDMEEYGIEIATAIKNLKRDGLECVFKDNSNLQPFVNLDLSFGDSNSELLQVIKKLGLMMSSLGHALYKGDIYVKPPSANFTYVLMMDVESYINKLMISDVIGEEIVKFAKRIIEIMCHPECEVIKQIKFNWALIEVKDGKCFSISNRDFIEGPIDLKDIGLISPRAFASYYDSSKDPAPSYFKESIENSFPNLATRINFLNKYYQCLTVNKFPHKCPKLVVAGPRDSGKTTWASVFLSVIPFRYITSITKGKTFSTAMINADTQLVLLDEWSPDHLQSDTAKLLLQGGLMISAVKYEKARMFINNSAFYITTNNVPNFGEDEDANVKRRLKIFETRSMPNPNSKIEPWYRQNSMHCIAWVAKEITKHRALVEKDELWYEDVSNERGEAEKIADLANGGGAAFFDVDKVKNLKFKDIFGPDTEKEKSDEKTIDEAAEPDSLIHESFISEAQTTIEKRKTDLEQTNTIE